MADRGLGHLERELLERRTCGAPRVVASTPRPINEESGTLWLWAWPELLGWPRDLVWVFSPVTGNTTWPGDLWGVDEDGALLLVETKLGGSPKDPFQDFMAFEAPPVSKIRRRWEALYGSERTFMNRRGLAALKKGTLAPKLHRGVVPYSRKRREVRRWAGLYLRDIAPNLRNRHYAKRVHRYLDRRREDSPTHFLAVFTLHDGQKAALSTRGLRRRNQLARRVGEERLHMLAVEGREVRWWWWEILSYRLGLGA